MNLNGSAIFRTSLDDELAGGGSLRDLIADENAQSEMEEAVEHVLEVHGEVEQ